MCYMKWSWLDLESASTTRSSASKSSTQETPALPFKCLSLGFQTYQSFQSFFLRCSSDADVVRAVQLGGQVARSGRGAAGGRRKGRGRVCRRADAGHVAAHATRRHAAGAAVHRRQGDQRKGACLPPSFRHSDRRSWPGGGLRWRLVFLGGWRARGVGGGA
jgi:hypothetical protein